MVAFRDAISFSIRSTASFKPATSRLQRADIGLQRADIGLQRADIGLQRADIGLQHPDVGLQCSDIGLDAGHAGLDHLVLLLQTVETVVNGVEAAVEVELKLTTEPREPLIEPLDKALFQAGDC